MLAGLGIGGLAIAGGADPYGRIYLADYTRNLNRLAYTRSGAIYTPQADGTLALSASDALPGEWSAALGIGGYRVDPGWTQSLLHSHAHTNAVWSQVAMQPATQDGPLAAGIAAWSLVEDATTAYRYRQQTMAFTSGTTYTVCAYVTQRAGSRFVQLRLPGNAFGVAYTVSLNPRTGAVQAVNGALNVGAAAYGGGYLMWITAQATASVSGVVRIQLAVTQGAADESYAGDGASGVDVWCLNATNTAYPVPLTLSTTAAVTIGSPSWTATLAALGITLGSEYTLGVEYVAAPMVGTPPVRAAIQVDDATLNNRSVIRSTNAANGVQSVIRAAAVNTYADSATVTEGQLVKAAVRVAAAGSRASWGGTLGAASGAISVPSGVTTVRLGAEAAATSILPGLIRRAWLIPSRGLTDAELQAVTG